jgi:hypothetical protein
MIIESVRNPQWVNAEHTMIDVVVKFGHFTDEVPFTANKNDVAQHGRELFALIESGKYGEIAEYVAPPESEPLLLGQPQPTVDGAQTL